VFGIGLTALFDLPRSAAGKSAFFKQRDSTRATAPDFSFGAARHCSRSKEDREAMQLIWWEQNKEKYGSGALGSGSRAGNKVGLMQCHWARCWNTSPPPLPSSLRL
jgi:hypothetical protein